MWQRLGHKTSRPDHHYTKVHSGKHSGVNLPLFVHCGTGGEEEEGSKGVGDGRGG